ncbi:MAG: prolyl oligopeptidase family serine peptidase [Oscillochloridaceae bacterium umkhey_bin13]
MLRLRWALGLLALVLLATITPVAARPLPGNILLVDQIEEVPADLLDEAELERLTRLQRETVYTLPISPVSPDDAFVLVSSEEQIGLLDLREGDIRPLDLERFGPYLPLPLAGFSRFSWLDTQTLGVLGLDLSAGPGQSALVRIWINRADLSLRVERLRVPLDALLVSIAPDLRRMLLALPQEPQNDELADFARRATRVLPGATRPDEAHPPVPAALQARIAAARQTHALAFDRLRLLQDGAAPDPEAPPDEQFDLVMFADGQTGYHYVTTIAAASSRFGEAWTPDSGRLAISFFGLPDRGATRGDRDGALLLEEIYRDATGNLPPAANPILQGNNTYLIEAANGTTSILRASAGAAPPLLAAHAFAPDGATLLVKAYYPARLRGRTHPIYNPQFSERGALIFYDRNLRERGRLEGDRFSSGWWSSAQAEFVSPDEIIFRTNTGTDRHVYYYNQVSGELRNLADRAGAYFNVFSTNQSREIVFTHTSFTEPPDVYRMGWDGKGLVRLTWQGEALRQLAALRQDPVRFTLPNGEVRTGVLIQPASASFPPRRVPIVLWQEGGPGPAMTSRWATNVEEPTSLLPAMGVAVLVTPLVGRGGLTPALFNRLVDGANFGQADIDEQAVIARELVRRGWTTPTGLGLVGCSYGGYMALQSAVRHPNLYAAINPQCALVDLVTEWTRGFDSLAPYMQGLPPYNNPEEYRRDSPSYAADRIRAATLSFHGTEDYLPIVQNQNLHAQLVARERTARMVIFAGEGHGLGDPDNQLYAAQEQLVWFREHLR